MYSKRSRVCWKPAFKSMLEVFQGVQEAIDGVLCTMHNYVEKKYGCCTCIVQLFIV